MRGERMREYKILTQKDKWFSQKFDPEVLETAINSYAEQGWRVVSMTTASIPGWASNREELIVLFERDR
jgi:predicted rRNA methylase YqxC with S4 and FtsJ domains